MTKSSNQTPIFHYYSGEFVMEGDIVKSGNGNPGVIEKVIAPGSADGDAWSCPEGGVLIREDWQGTPSYLVEVPPDGIYWEDLEFIRRGGAEG